MGESSQGAEMRDTIIKFGGVSVYERIGLASHSTDIWRYVYIFFSLSLCLVLKTNVLTTLTQCISNHI